jgi:hypothetical protein
VEKTYDLALDPEDETPKTMWIALVVVSVLAIVIAVYLQS